jgi:hypothetical protein
MMGRSTALALLPLICLATDLAEMQTNTFPLVYEFSNSTEPAIMVRAPDRVALSARLTLVCAGISD